MKSSSRSNTYVQNVKFGLFRVKSHFDYNQKARYSVPMDWLGQSVMEIVCDGDSVRV